MVSKGILWLVAAGGLSLAAFGKDAPKIAPIPADSLEMVSGPIEVADTPAKRGAAAELLARARDSYALQSEGYGYDLKVTFTVDSGGQTDYDGAWEMEDVFDPRQGLRWTAKAAAGYTITEISANEMFYRDGTASTIPLRLHEARAVLFGPIPSAGYVDHDLIRTSMSTFNGTPVTCVLLSSAGSRATNTPGRRWEETEECIDPQSGLLQVHSQVPGRYYAYEYSNGAQLGGHVFPRKVIVTEGGKIVSEISVDSLVGLPAADPSLFVPAGEMKAGGQAIALEEARKISRFAGRGLLAFGGTAHPVCVFGLVTPSGQLIEAHSLQPSDPNSARAVEAARRMKFAYPAPPGARPQQHFVFVIEKFISSR